MAMRPEELAAILRQIAEQEAAERRDAEMAKAMQRAEEEAAKARARSAGSHGGAAAAVLPERKRDLEILAQQQRDEEFARMLSESLNPGQNAAGRGGLFREESKRNLEQQAIRRAQLEQAERDALLARELQNSLNGGGSAAAAPRAKPLVDDRKADLEQDALLAKQLQAEQERARLAQDTSNDALLAQALAEGSRGKDDISNDAILARELQRQFEAKEKEDRMRGSAASQDAAIARAMQQAEGGNRMLQQFENARKKRAMVTGEEWKKIAASLQEILDSNAVIGDPVDPRNPAGLTDAHKYTRTLIRAGIPVLFALDKQFKLSEDNLSPEQVLKEVLAFLETLSVVPERVSVDHIKGTFARIATAPALEAAETNANAHHLLSRAWTLAKKRGPAFMEAIATSLSENISDAGGCIPGLIARLYAPYALIMGLELGLSPKADRAYQKR